MSAVTPFPVAWRRISSVALLPHIARLLSTDQPSAGLPTRKADQAHVALCRLEDGTNAVFAVDPDHEAVGILEDRAAKAGLSVSARYQIAADMLQTIYGGHAKVTHVTARDDADEAWDALLHRAVTMRATDIHFRSSRNTADIEFRIDGILERVETIQIERAETLMRALHARHVGRKDDWVRDRFVQAAATRTVDGLQYRVRYQHLPNMLGTVDLRLRILPLASEAAAATDFATVGFEPDQIKVVQAALSHPRGLFLLCGPMGSGKSTTLKIAMEYLVARYGGGQLIQTLEDPVEFQVVGVSQCPVDGDIADEVEDNRKWSEALAAIMRSDANTIMLGETRNAATARASMHLTQTGHKILSTLHAISPFEAISRLMNLGWERDVLTAQGNISAILRQQLIPLLCPACATPLHVDSLLREDRRGLENLLRDDLGSLRTKGAGCDHCSGRGTVGRTALLEVLVPDRRINEHLVAGRRDVAEELWRARQAGIAHGLEHVTLLDHAATKLRRGQISALDVSTYVQPLAQIGATH